MSTFENIKEILKELLNYMNISDKEISILLNHEKISKAFLELDGKKYEAWRIVHNTALGPGKGGIRFHSDVSEDEIKSLSFWMSLKTSLMNLPFGGAKGGIKINPKELTEKQLETLSREYIKAFHNILGENIDVPAPDVYTNSQIMAWMLDEYEKIKNKKEPAMITGKPIELGGLKLRSDSTSKGGLIILKEFLKKYEKNKKPSEIKVSIQGFGNAGMNLAKMLYSENFKIIAVSDSKGGIFSEQSIKIDEVIKVKEKGSIQDYENKEIKKITNKELLELESDILILAALENQITDENVNEIKSGYILEIANGPISSNASKKLFERNILVIPDILANAGGVVVSYFEWANNKSGNILEEDYLKDKFEKIMVDSFNKVHDIYKLYQRDSKEIDLRKAAYILAIKRILDAEKSRGNLT